MDFLSKHFIRLLLLSIISAPGFAFAGDLPQLGWRLDGDAFLRFGEGIETAHTPWAKPAATGRIRTLILANQDGACDVPELARRFDLDFVFLTEERQFEKCRGTPAWRRLEELFERRAKVLAEREVP